MLLLRLSGHSGAGKSRLIAALPHYGISCPRAVLYTSRDMRKGENDGTDYHFRSREIIDALPRNKFFVGQVREMLQAINLEQLVDDLKGNDLVLIEIFDKLWPEVENAIVSRMGQKLRTASVFMTAVDPDHLNSLPDRRTRAAYVEDEVKRILDWRHKDEPEKIKSKAESAPDEVLAAIEPNAPYMKVFHSSPEGPDGQDNWTRYDEPDGRAAQVLKEFIEFVNVGSGS